MRHVDIDMKSEETGVVCAFSVNGTTTQLILQDSVEIAGKQYDALFLHTADTEVIGGLPFSLVFDAGVIDTDGLRRSALLPRLIERIVEDADNQFWSLKN